MDEREYRQRIRDGTMPLIESGTPPHFIKSEPPLEKFFGGIHIHEPNQSASDCKVCKKIALENRISKSRWI